MALLIVAFLAAIGRPQATGPIQVSASGIVQVAAIPLLGPVGAALVASLPVLFDRNESIKRLFNISQRILFVIAGSVAYTAVGGPELAGQIVGVSLPALALQVGVAAATTAVANALLMTGIVRLTSTGSVRAIFEDLLRQVLYSYGSYAVAAYLIVILWAPAGMGWVAILFFIPSLFVIQWGLRQHAAEWAVRHELLTPFVHALDLRYPGAAQDADRAAAAAKAIANGIGLPPAVVDEVATAARIRWVGLLALPGASPAILRREHPAAARRVLGGLTFLDRPLHVVAAHHERVDGRGPLGLSDHHIPVGARVVAVAGVWSQRVSEGRSPGEAVRDCESMAGQSLDPRCVAALRRAFQRDQLPGGPS